ncbi:STN domain-containing protein [Sphingobacterium sp. IITKGP-BTPF85]|uniref:STN domain-containing protein n=1 Tax=Sphingobacterium sp. IITKGP-BTPF85 TaxID=1338009 RepID=UPI00038A0927|nr:STN domain-containing protein [Sphingobacterium sp. IITKGP-BTPF85]KKX50089.1 hypothetical protein L950_0212180 [Sphingobacterium sp. IITKGP-BTPF85]
MNFLLLSTPLFPRTWKKNSLLLALSFSCLLTQAQQGILQTKVSIQIKNQTIAQALEKIEEKTGCSFIYSPNLIDAQKKYR